MELKEGKIHLQNEKYQIVRKLRERFQNKCM